VPLLFFLLVCSRPNICVGLFGVVLEDSLAVSVGGFAFTVCVLLLVERWVLA